MRKKVIRLKSNFVRNIKISVFDDFKKKFRPAMKVAIPTDDGLHVSAKCEKAKGFFIACIENGKIIREEMRWNPETDPADPRTAALAVIEDCNVIIAGDQLLNCKELHPVPDKELFVVREKIITNVMVDYLTLTAMRESNTCCCP